MTANQLHWLGKSGLRYAYAFVDMRRPFRPVGGNYIFARRQPSGGYLPIYIGETGDLSQRLPNHEVWPQARLLGATHAFAHETPNALARLTEERDLIGLWNPPLNSKHRTL